MAGLKSWKEAANKVKGLRAAASFGGVIVKDGAITHGKESVPLCGARLSVESEGEVDKRITATRLVLTGPLALAWRKKKDTRELYLTVENDGAMFVVAVDPKEGLAARQFAAKVNTLASR